MRFKFKIFFSIIFPLVLFNINYCDFLRSRELNSSEFSESGYIYKDKTSQYIIGKGDGLRIKVSQVTLELNTEALVNGEGNINLPSLGKIFVEGLTLEELSSELNIAYKKYVKYPNVEVTISRYRPIKILVEGEVNNPGLYTLKGSIRLESNQSLIIGSESELLRNPEDRLISKDIVKNINSYFPTVFDALRSGGGVTEFSDISKIKVIRQDSLSNGGGKISTTLNFNDLFKNGKSEQNIRIYDGDLIVVGKSKNPDKKTILSAVRSNLNPKYIQVFVTGKVNSPGSKVIVKASTLNDAIDISGGVKALRGPINYLSNSNNGSVDKRRIRYRKNASRGSFNNPYLKDGDLIFVGTSIFSNAASAINEITSPFQGIYSTYRLIELINE